MSLPRYAAYKESGAEVVRQIPSHWKTPPLYLRYQTDLGKMLDAARISGENLRPYLRNVDVQWGYINFEDLPQMDITPSEVARYTVQRGDLLVCEGGEVGRAAVVDVVEGATAFQKALHRLRPIHQDEVSKYMFYVLCWAADAGAFSTNGQSTIAHLTGEQLRKYRFPCPLHDEQTAIATFLDRETGKIDTLIANQEKLLALLAEKRQATISHAVIKGLNPDAPMKDSGVAWLGEVPEHWDIKPMGVICHLIQTGPFGSQLHAEDYVEDGTPVINPSNLINGRIRPDWKCTVATEMVEKLTQHVLQYGDIVFARRGEMGRCAMVQQENVGWLCGTGSLNLRLAVGSPKYLATYLGTPMVRELLKLESVGSTMENLNAGILSRVRVPFPPEAEQLEISAFLGDETAKLDALKTESERAIVLLKERRSALIAAAVTGQIDVRGLVTEPEAA